MGHRRSRRGRGDLQMRTKPTMHKRMLRSALVAAFSTVVAFGALSGLAGAKGHALADSTWRTGSVTAVAGDSTWRTQAAAEPKTDDSTWRTHDSTWVVSAESVPGDSTWATPGDSTWRADDSTWAVDS